MEVEPFFRNAYGNLTNSGWNSIPNTISANSKKRKLNLKSKSSKKRKLGSRTRTTSGSQWGQQVPSGGGESKSLTLIKNPKLPMGIAKDMLAVNSVNSTYSSTATALVGKQNIALLGAYIDFVDVSNFFTALGQTATGTNSAKLAVISVNANILLTNSSSINNHVDIYDCYSRQDGSDFNPNPASVLTLGGVDAVGGAAADYTVPGYTPYENPRFCSAYKIVKRTPIILSPGQTHVHSVVYKTNKVFSRERLITNDGSGPIGGVTYYTFAFFHGTPVHDAATEATVTTGQTKLDWVELETTKFKAMSFNYASNSIVNTLSTTMIGPEQFVTDNPLDTANTL